MLGYWGIRGLGDFWIEGFGDWKNAMGLNYGFDLGTTEIGFLPEDQIDLHIALTSLSSLDLLVP